MACVIIQLGHSFALPPLQRAWAAQLTFYPRRRCKRDISNSLIDWQTNNQTKGHWQVHYKKLLAFCPRRTPLCSAWSHKPGKRIKSSHFTSHRPHSLEMQPKRPSQIRPALNYPLGKKRRGSTVRWTNLWNKGLTSADRSNKATLLLTVPRPDSSRLQRIHPRTYHDCNSRTNRPDISV